MNTQTKNQNQVCHRQTPQTELQTQTATPAIKLIRQRHGKRYSSKVLGTGLSSYGWTQGDKATISIRGEWPETFRIEMDYSTLAKWVKFLIKDHGLAVQTHHDSTISERKQKS